MLSKYKSFLGNVDKVVVEEILETIHFYGADKGVFEKRLAEVLSKHMESQFQANAYTQICEDLRKHLNNGLTKN